MSKLTLRHLKNDMCRWPIGDPGNRDFHFCGQRSRPARPYCEYHADIATNRAPAKKTGPR
jgi:GcrA cell cycle regulator